MTNEPKTTGTPRWHKSKDPHTPGAFLKVGRKQIGRVLYSDFTRNYSCFVGQPSTERWLGCADSIDTAKIKVSKAAEADAKREAQVFPAHFDLRPMNCSVQDLEQRAPGLPAMILSREFVTRTIESALLRIPLPAAVLSYDNAAQRLVVRSGGSTLAAFQEFMRQGSEARLLGVEFALPDGWAGATFAELPGRAKTRIRETPLRLYTVPPTVSDALVVSLSRRMNGSLAGETA
ncbi:hypothetical protein [Streptomyces drozdowiczii]